MAVDHYEMRQAYLRALAHSASLEANIEDIEEEYPTEELELVQG